MITYLYIDGFKSFRDFEMYFSPFTAIAGTNASGKSNLFDAISLLSNLANGMSLQEVFQNLRGEGEEAFTLFSNGSRADLITLKVDMLVDRHIKDAWGQETDLKCTRLRYELKLRYTDDLMGGHISIEHESLAPIPKKYDEWSKAYDIKDWELWRPGGRGAKRTSFIISSLDLSDIPAVEIRDGDGSRKHLLLSGLQRTVLSKFDSIEHPHIYAAKKEMKHWRFLHLNPTELRTPMKDTVNSGVLTPSGNNIAGVLMGLKQRDPYNVIAVSRMLEKFLPNYVNVDVVRDEENKRLVLTVEDTDGCKYSSRVLSEGTLRLLALCVLAVDDSFAGTLCFEEPENGIHPFRLESMAKLLDTFSTNFTSSDEPLRQIIVNSHSPLFMLFVKALNNPFVTNYVSRLVTHIGQHNGTRVKVSATRMTPVFTTPLTHLLNISENELKKAAMTESEFLNYMRQPNIEERF